MNYYKNILRNKRSISAAGASKGAKPSWLMPPKGAWSKIGYQIYESTDLLCEGPIAGLCDQKGKILDLGRTTKDFDSETNKRGSSTNGIDKGCYFNGVPLRTEDNVVSHSKYDVELRVGKENQEPPKIMALPSKMERVGVPIKGPYSMAGSANGARTGNGSRDVRNEGKAGRDFVNWQNFVPSEKRAKPWIYQNYDRDINNLLITLQVDALSDTKSYATKSQNEKGTSRMGQHLKTKVTFKVEVGKADSTGNETISPADFFTRAGGGVSVQGGGLIQVQGVVTSPYAISLEGIILPTLDDGDLYNFIKVSKIEHETFSNLVKRNVAISSITKINSLRFSYPNSSYVSVSLDSKYFPSVPERTFRVKGKKILIPSNYNPTNADGTDRRFSKDGSTAGNLIYNGDWDGTFKFEWSDNPAWIYFDLLINTRYGLGSHLRDPEIVDKWTIYEIGMYCDAVTMNDGSKATVDAGGAGYFVGMDDGYGGLEPRFSCNLLIKDQKTALGALEDLGRSFMAIMYYHNSNISVRVDRPYFFEDFNRTDEFDADPNNFLQPTEVPPKNLKYPPAMIFNNLNVKDGVFAYADVDRSTKLSAVEVTYLDKRYNFESKTEYVEDTEAIKYVGLNYKSLDAIGCTSRAQARRLARHIMFESLYTTETVSFDAGFDALLIEPGDIIRVDDEIRSFHKNFGVVLGTSGTADYKNPDGIYKDSPPSGIGPRSIIVSPAVASNQIDYISGGVINIQNALGKESVYDFYENPTTGNEFYKDIHRPQIVSLKIKPGGSGVSWDPCDSGIAIHIDGLNDYLNGSGASQWFAEKSANINYGSPYSIDVSGIDPKYYRVISTKEQVDGTIGVSASIHHTGKFAFVDEGVNFDLNTDTFQPALKITEINRPSAPTSVIFNSLSNRSDNAKTLNLTINDPASNPPEKYIIILEEPNGKNIQTEVRKSAGSSTYVSLDEDVSRIDQLGDYTVLVFSENKRPLPARSLLATSMSFTTSFSDFNFSSSSSLYNYLNIELEPNFESTYSETNRIGQGVQLYPYETGLVSRFRVTFEDLFGGSGYDIINEVDKQSLDLRKLDGTLIQEGFKNIRNQEIIEITVAELDEATSYIGDGRYEVPPNIDFEVDSFTVAPNTLNPTGIVFNKSFDETPAVFISQETDSSNQRDYINKLGRVSGESGKFFVKTVGSQDFSRLQKFNYIASKTGSFNFDQNNNRLEIHFVQNTYQQDYKYVEFEQPFDSTPIVYIQSQQPDIAIEDYFCETCITGITTNGFFYKAFQANLEMASGTGKFAYIAAKQDTFNILSSSKIGVASLNYASTQTNNVDFDSTPILNGLGGSAYKFDYNDYSVLPQRVEQNPQYDNMFFSVQRHGTKNTVRLNVLQTGLEPGISSENSNNNIDRIQFSTANGFGTGNFSIMTWATFDPALAGRQSIFNNPGIFSWIQSGDGKNYLFVNNGLQKYEAITGQTTLNDGNIKHIGISMDREAALMTTYLNGVPNKTVDISELKDFSYTTGFKLTGVGAALEDIINGDFVTGFDGINMGAAFNIFSNSNTLDGRYTGAAGGSVFINENTSGFRFEKQANNYWYIVDRDSSSSSYNKTGWRSNLPGDYPWSVDPFWFNVITNQTQTVDVTSDLEVPRNTASMDGFYTGVIDPDGLDSDNVFQNLTTSGFKVKISNTRWAIMDDDPGSVTYNKTGWYQTPQFIDYPWDTTSTWFLDLNSKNFGTSPTFSDISPYVPSSLNHPTNVCQLLNEPTFSTITNLYQGRLHRYISAFNSALPSTTFSNYYNLGGSPPSSSNGEFDIRFTDFPNLVDSSLSNNVTTAISVVGDVNRDYILHSDFPTANVDFNFLQIGTSGSINRLNERKIGVHPLTDGFKIDFSVGDRSNTFSSGEASFSVTLPDYGISGGISGLIKRGADSIYSPTGEGQQYLDDFDLVENVIEFDALFTGSRNDSGIYNIRYANIYTGETADFSPDYIDETNLVTRDAVAIRQTGQKTLLSVSSGDISGYTGFLYYKCLPRDYIKTGNISNAVRGQMFFGFPDSTDITGTGTITISRANANDLFYNQSDGPVQIFGISGSGDVNIHVVNDVPLDWEAVFTIRTSGQVTVTSDLKYTAPKSFIDQAFAIFTDGKKKLSFPDQSGMNEEFTITSSLNSRGNRTQFLVS